MCLVSVEVRVQRYTIMCSPGTIRLVSTTYHLQDVLQLRLHAQELLLHLRNNKFCAVGDEYCENRHMGEEIKSCSKFCFCLTVVVFFLSLYFDFCG